MRPNLASNQTRYHGRPRKPPRYHVVRPQRPFRKDVRKGIWKKMFAKVFGEVFVNYHEFVSIVRLIKPRVNNK